MTWYFITYYECPICSHTIEIRERREGARPDDWYERHEVVPDPCSDHFISNW